MCRNAAVTRHWGAGDHITDVEGTVCILGFTPYTSHYSVLTQVLFCWTTGKYTFTIMSYHIIFLNYRRTKQSSTAQSIEFLLKDPNKWEEITVPVCTGHKKID